MNDLAFQSFDYTYLGKVISGKGYLEERLSQGKVIPGKGYLRERLSQGKVISTKLDIYVLLMQYSAQRKLENLQHNRCYKYFIQIC